MQRQHQTPKTFYLQCLNVEKRISTSLKWPGCKLVRHFTMVTQRESMSISILCLIASPGGRDLILEFFAFGP